ncbi:MAG: AAA family ATPase, partial [Desulfohalobiaceae bacterium]
MSRIISIASGKGGVGKTSLTVNLAYCLALQDERTCLVDADLGLANVDILLGLEPKHTLEQAVLSDQISLRDCLIPVHDNLDILPGASGVPSLAGLESQQRRALLQGLQELQEYDYLLIDNSPGIIPSV